MNRENNDIFNLIAIPKPLHEKVHTCITTNQINLDMNNDFTK
jgi:hypothetical protein